ncbi:MAG: hypothetical protein QOE35_3963 [Actinomycetota bacterium]|jgi:ubiquinone/menaquinone biosynthesis C-methylase UbiE
MVAADPDPRQHKANVASRFGDVASVYDTVVEFFGPFGRALVEAAAITRGEHVLDIACGAGAVLGPATATGASVWGVDIAPEMAARARVFAPTALADAEHLPAADSAFDAVMCGFGVFFFPDPARAFAEVRRVLRPTGRFAASTFADGVAGFPWSTELAREVGRPSPWKQSPVVKVDGLRAALHDTGFTSVVTTRVERRFSFNDIEHYQAWYGTHGGAQLLHELADDAGRLGHWRRRSTVLLERDGYAFTQRVDLTVADR